MLINEIKYLNINGKVEQLDIPIYFSDEPVKNSINLDNIDIEIFAEHYNLWKEETQFLSVGEFDNRHFKAICNPEIVPIWQTINGVYLVLLKTDDKVVYALDKALLNFTDKRLIDVEGYVSLHEYCNAWRIVLSLFIESFKDIENEALNGVKNY